MQEGRAGTQTTSGLLCGFSEGGPTEETGWEGAPCEASTGFRISPVENSPGKKKKKHIFLKVYHRWQNHSCDLKIEENGLASLQGCAD